MGVLRINAFPRVLCLSAPGPDEETPFGIPKVDRNARDFNKKKAYYVASLIMCLKHSNGEGMPGWKPIPNE